MSAGSVESLTLADLERFLETPDRHASLDRYLDAAAVLAAFDPTRLQPVDGKDFETTPDYLLGALLPLCDAVTDGAHRGLWQLTLPERRAALRRLGTGQAMKRALKANPKRPDTALQRMFERVLIGKPLELERLTREDVAALLTVGEWVLDILPGVPDEAVLERALRRQDLTAPMRRLMEGGFVDRTGELSQLRKYVSGAPFRPPLFVFGPGGVGKSTLIAKFLLGEVERTTTAFAYLDIDRPTIQPKRPLTLLLQALEQLGPQLDEPDAARALAEQIAESIGREEATRQVESMALPDDYWIAQFGSLLDRAASGRASIIAVDTFEEAQYHGPDVVRTLAEFLVDMTRSLPSVRLIVSGRSLPAEFAATAFPDVFGLGGEGVFADEPLLAGIALPDRPINLGLLDLPSARELLKTSVAHAGLKPLTTNDLDDVIGIVSRNPMCLRLAARVLRVEGLDKLRSAPTELFATLRAEKIQALLYGRILSHVHGEDVEKIAYPGLIVRRITPEVIRDVLAGPCELELTAERDENVLFDDLRKEAALLDLDPDDGSLRHRTDVRRAMLEDLTDHVRRSVIDEIDEAAIAFYEAETSMVARAEEIYHRLRRREPAQTLDSRWDPAAGVWLKNVGEEVPAQQRLWLADKLGTTLDSSVRETASQEEWEAQASLSASRFLQRSLADRALEVLAERTKRLPRSELYSLEAEAYRFLGRHDDALKVARAGVESLSKAGAIDMALELLLKMVAIEEGRDNFEAAGELVEEAIAVSSHTSNDVLALQASVTNLRVHRARYPSQEAPRARLRSKALGLLTPEVLRELKSRPVLLREVAAELAGDHAELASAAIEMLGFEVATDDQAQQLAQALSALAGESSLEESPVGNVVEEVVRLVESEADPAEVRDWVSKHLTSRDRRAIVGLLAESDSGAESLREFRDYFRTGTESRLRVPEAVGRHGSETYFVIGEGLLGETGGGRERTLATALEAEIPPFRFSRMGPTGVRQPSGAVRRKIAAAMVAGRSRESRVPAGFTYLGKFVTHDITFDSTRVMLGENVTPAALLQARSPTLDLTSLYGAGPSEPASAVLYEEDGLHLRTGETLAAQGIEAKYGFDLPRGAGTTAAEQRRAIIADSRNDENLPLAQTHLALIRFHNRVVDTLPASILTAERFARARDIVTKHYQWMLCTDYLPRICARRVVDDVFKNGRKVFEVGAGPLDVPTMPIEFSVAAFRLGHSMVRSSYNWNRKFEDGAATLDFLLAFSEGSGRLGGGMRLPSNWIADFRRLYDFGEAGREDLVVPAAQFNRAMRIDTLLVSELQTLPGFVGDEANLAFRNLTRAAMVRLASGQQMAAFLKSRGAKVTKLTSAQIKSGKGGADLGALTDAQRTAFLRDTPLWFYVLREAELGDGGLRGVGARIVAETFHRAMEGSAASIVRDPTWRPSLGPDDKTFRMVDLLLFAFEGKKELLAPLG